MSDPTLIPGRVVYEYAVEGGSLFKHDDKEYVAADAYVEADAHYPNHVAVQIVTTDNHTFTYQGNSHGNMPLIARRLFERHQKMRKL